MDASEENFGEENFGEENFGEENFGEENFGEENFVEHDTTIIPEDPDPEEVQGQDDDSEVGDVEKRWPGWPGESVFRILVPAQKVGGIIGRKGEFIKKMCEETRARIKILDGPHGIQERAVLISAKEEPDAALPPAIDGLLRVHRRIVEGLDGDPANAQPGMVTSSRLLVPAAQAGSLIGKQGTTIKSIQEASNTIVRVIGSDNLPFFALQDDRVVEIQGEPTGVHKALELVAFHLRKFLVDRSIVGVFEKQMQMPNSPMEHNMPPPHQSWGPPQGFPPNAGPAPGFGGHPQYMPPHQGHPPMRQHDSYYPPADQPPMDKQPPHQGLSMYGRDAAPMGVHSSNNAQPPPQIITQITQHMQVPLSYADAVIGTGGANISYTRRASGATVTIQETRGVPGEMTVEINGTASQVQAAQQLVQNFMADAAGASQNPAGGSVDSNYNSYPTQNSSYPTQNSSYPSQNLSYPTQNPSYPSQNSMYSSPSANAGQPAGGYGPVYGTNYGY